MSEPNIDDMYHRYLLGLEVDAAREDVHQAAEAKAQATLAYDKAVDAFIKADDALRKAEAQDNRPVQNNQGPGALYTRHMSRESITSETDVQPVRTAKLCKYPRCPCNDRCQVTDSKIMEG